jgi:1-acyl-sn-glycerol-3-phosphate acyltransferase
MMRVPAGTLRSLVFGAAFYVSTAAFLLGGSWLFFAPRSWAMQGLRLHGLFCTWLLKVICGTGMEVRGAERLQQRPCLVVSKHQSAWDTFALIPVFRDPAIVLKEELKWVPFYGWFCLKFEHILVRRERAAAALKRLVADAKDRAAAGREVFIFPEGTRRPPGAEPDYKRGYVALYEGLGLVCYPVALNSGLYWPRRKFARYPGTIIVEILEPIPPGLPRAEFRRRLESCIEQATERLLIEALGGPAPPPLDDAVRERLLARSNSELKGNNS